MERRKVFLSRNIIVKRNNIFENRGGERVFFRPLILVCRAKYQGRTYLRPGGLVKDGAYYCYCAYVLRISRYSGFLSVMRTNAGIFLRGLKLCRKSRSS